MKPESNYDAIAPFYDRHWTDRYQPLAFEILTDTMLKQLPAGASVLDLGCGTGSITQKLLDRGYKVVGIDISPEMIRCAKSRVPEGTFSVADARSCRFRRRFDGVISLFDTLNHILTSGEMLSVFRNIYSALIPGGIFVFDLNMEEAYDTQWDKWSAHVYPDEVCIVRGGYHRESRTGHTEITLFSHDSGWQREDLYFEQRCYPEDEIRRLLRLAGFRCAHAETAASLGMRDDDLATGRKFFTART